MKIGLLYQCDKTNAFPWQINCDLYSGAEMKMQEMETILISLGYTVQTWNGLSAFISDLKHNKVNVDLMFNNIENCFGRNYNGYIPALLDMLNIPYIGNDAYINTISADKFIMNHICKSLRIPFPNTELFYSSDTDHLIEKVNNLNFRCPLILKYRYGTMSHHTKLVYSRDEMLEQLYFMLSSNNGDVICQEYICGREITVPIIGDGSAIKVLSVIEYTDNHATPLPIYDSKWKGEYDRFVLLNELKDNMPLTLSIKKAALRLYKYLGFKDYGRMDFRLSENNTIYFLEANSVPSLAGDGAFDPSSYGGKENFSHILNSIIVHAAKRYKFI